MKNIALIFMIIVLSATPAFPGQANKASKIHTGKWLIESKIDPMTDKKINTIMLYADQGKNYMGSPFKLMIRCSNDALEMFIAWNEYISEDRPVVNIRLGKAPIEQYITLPSSDNTATFIYDYEINPLLRKLLFVNSAVAQVQPYKSAPITAVFNVQNLKDAIDRVKNDCPMINLSADEMESKLTSTSR